jgi:hypothetical protein
VSAKKKSSRKFKDFGVSLDPEFSVTPHVNGVHYLLGFLAIFQ